MYSMAAQLILNEKQSDCFESPEAKNLSVKTSLLVVEIGSHIQVVVRCNCGPTRESKC